MEPGASCLSRRIRLPSLYRGGAAGNVYPFRDLDQLYDSITAFFRDEEYALQGLQPDGAGQRPGTVVRGTVLHVFDHSFPIGDGYANRSGEIIRFTRQSGWKTVHVTSGKQGPTQSGVETARGLEFHRTQPSSRFLHRLPVLDQWSIVSCLKARLHELVRLVRPDVLHVHSPCLNALAAQPVARRYGVPLIYEVRALWEDGAVDNGSCREGDLRYRTSRMLETVACRRSDHVVTICEGLRQDLHDRGIPEERLTVVPNSVDLDRFGEPAPRDEALARELGLTEGRTLGFIGSFFPFEGLDVLMRAVPAIHAEEPDVRVLVVGDGTDAERIRNIVQQAGIGHLTIFTGRVPHEEVARFYALMDVLVYPRVSRRVTELVTPLKPLEAMAQGKLVVASDVGGHREMVFPGRNGVLFRAGDPQSLAAECVRLLRSPGQWPALRAGGMQYVQDARSWKRNALLYDRLYSDVIRLRRAAA